MDRRNFIRPTSLSGIALAGNRFFVQPHDAFRTNPFEIELTSPCKLFDGKTCWAHPRAGMIPETNGRSFAMVMAKLDLEGNDIFTEMYGFETNDAGLTWSTPKKIEALSVRTEIIGGKNYYRGIGDVVPQHHNVSKKLLATGHTITYDEKWKPASPLPKRTAYAVYDQLARQWGDWKVMDIPAELGYKAKGAGCCQRYDLTDGTILLPVSFKKNKGNSGVTVMKCTFDGTELKYASHGNELFIDDQTRGLGEPSLTFFKGRYLLTIRHNERGYISTSKDGLNFNEPKAWTFDDGQDLGNYNTQQHWVTHSNALYLLYTRRGANNDHVFRNRAPLFMAEVDTTNLSVIRKSEKAVMPQRGARLGNFGITNVSPHQTWITDCEWMQPKGAEKYGSDGSVYVSKIHWKKKNKIGKA